ncbi:uncharacterized protein LAESUDRAFT_693264 [Laetiporus sulphureus 93-53]|uniref:Uncharacterized protein n=1 Tax=Laetiporus sulphureus 93-53 TaxID=1314785 RepID=A0A165GV52_9APHY|nr:uncharacterized protein LAESUDRAFT_693264 [Laetiporus sulphureus 93-53]KZT10860.1 hypothetical protein LAESUDRAFT_693264 [Laetiporus sulphureus 93-53]
MCYHLVTYYEYLCAHQVPTRRHYIDCNQLTCRLSRFHNPVDHDCEADCTAIILPDQHIVMERRPEQCFTCRGLPTPPVQGPDVAGGMNGHGEHDSEPESSSDEEEDAQ